MKKGSEVSFSASSKRFVEVNLLVIKYIVSIMTARVGYRYATAYCVETLPFTLTWVGTFSAMLHCEDRNTVSKVWSGQIPVCFRLAAQDCSSIEAPDPFFIMLPRISYLPFIWEKVGVDNLVHTILVVYSSINLFVSLIFDGNRYNRWANDVFTECDKKLSDSIILGDARKHYGNY